MCATGTDLSVRQAKERFVSLANMWARLADDLERTLALLETFDDEDERERLTG
jgi:hypothetical protein